MRGKREICIPPMSAKSFIVNKGEKIRIIDVEGGQPGDFVAFNLNNFSEKFSQARTRVENRKFKVTENDTLWTNSNPPRVMFTITKDSCGTNDLLFTPCCRYALKTRFQVDRDGCLENLAKALLEWNITENEIPDPLNIFFNVEGNPSGEIRIGEQVSKRGDLIELRAEIDSLVAISTCSVPSSERENSPYKVELFDSLAS